MVIKKITVITNFLLLKKFLSSTNVIITDFNNINSLNMPGINTVYVIDAYIIFGIW
jgi:hypothetical protein